MNYAPSQWKCPDGVEQDAHVKEWINLENTTEEGRNSIAMAFPEVKENFKMSNGVIQYTGDTPIVIKDCQFWIVGGESK